MTLEVRVARRLRAGALSAPRLSTPSLWCSPRHHACSPPRNPTFRCDTPKRGRIKHRLVTQPRKRARRAAGRHPTFRLAMVVPWLGDSFPSWMVYFLESCKRADYLVDWLICHQDAAVPPAAPPNVHCVNRGPHGLGVQFGSTIAAATNQRNRTYALVKMFQL